MSEHYIAPWMQTAGGTAVDLTHPEIGQIHLSDLSIALDRIPRFNGHTVIDRVWTVARHSMLVANLVPQITEDHDPSLRLAALLHDAHECYTGDITAPVKAALVQTFGFDPFKRLEAPLRSAIYWRFCQSAELPPDWQAAIKLADLMALHVEKHLFMTPPPRPWADLPPLPDDPEEEVLAVDLYFDGGGSFQQLVETALREIAADA